MIIGYAATAFVTPLIRSCGSDAVLVYRFLERFGKDSYGSRGQSDCGFDMKNETGKMFWIS
jgi:hypothetical protein